MRTVDEQLARVLAATVRPTPVRVGIGEAHGLLCAEEVVADHGLPRFDQAAVDGYAVRSVDVQDAEEEPAELPVVGAVEAGARQLPQLKPGQAVRVATSAPLPTLADAVIPADHTEPVDSLCVQQSVPSAAYVRRSGEDVQPGDVAVRRGSPIGPVQVGLLAAAGRSKVLVHPRPRVSLISVGEELADVDKTLHSGQVYDVNSYALASAAREAGAEVTRLGIVSSDPKRIREVVEGRLLLSEIVVLSGAVGGEVGEQLQKALTDLGDLDISRVAMRPGSVQGFGQLGPDQVPTLMLPQNPVAALVSFEVFVRPLIRSALAKAHPHRRVVSASLLAAVHSPAGRRSFMHGQLLRDAENGSYLVRPLATSGKHLLAGLAVANALLIVDDESTELPAGEDVRVRFLSQRV